MINEKISRISRVVVHPKFRSIGLGAEIVRRTLRLAPTDVVETIGSHGEVQQIFFESAGMTPLELEEDQNFLNA